MRIHRQLAACALLTAALAVAPDSARAEDGSADVQAADERARFEGTFRYSGDAREAAAREAAIDRAVSSLFFAFRPIARPRLSDATRITPWISFALPEGRIRSRAAGGLDVSTPDNSSATPYVFRGERCRVTQRLVGSKLVQVFVADDGVGRNEWSVSADGAVLTVNVTISSPHLKAPMIYTLTYKRSG